MEKTRIDGLAGLQALVGSKLGEGEWHTLTFEDIQRFADATGDHQWIHVDRERIARESPFGAPIAHGYYTLSRVAALFLDLVEISGFSGVINYGVNKVRFPAPLKEGATYRLVANLTEVNEVKGGVEAIFQNTIEIRGESKPALVADCVFRFFA